MSKEKFRYSMIYNDIKNDILNDVYKVGSLLPAALFEKQCRC